MKTVWFLAGDYWHPAQTVSPLADKLFDREQWNVLLTENPRELLAMEDAPDLIVSIKDPIENNQIPTPAWCDAAWMDRLFACVREQGTGLLLIHAALADLKSDHPMVSEVAHAMFLGHPAHCPLTLRSVREHAIVSGVPAFTFPDNDEHYMMSMLDGAQVDILAQTESKNGVQPGLWVSELGRGRVCCVTPGHTTKNLLYAPYLRLLRNAVLWCGRSPSV